jgi:DNA-directed RNA polymerase subunit RPC12/RpoP
MVKREILRLIEEKLGYEFKLEELPPNLRAKIRKLEEERDIILRESLLYEEYKRRVIDGMQEHQRRISEFYDKKIEEAQRRMPHFDTEGWVLGGSFVMLCVGIINLLLDYYLYGNPISITKIMTTGLLWATVVPILLILATLLIILWKIANETRIEKEIMNLKKEKEEALRRGVEEYNLRVLPELESDLHAQEQKVKLLQEKFERDLSQLCSEIDSTLGIVFQGRMDFGLLRSIMRSRGIVIERIECPYCGASINLPETGHVTQCPYCGRNVYVADVFKELEKRFQRTGTMLY